MSLFDDDSMTMSVMGSGENFGIVEAPLGDNLLPSFSSAMSWPESFNESMEVAYHQWFPNYQPHADEDEHQSFMRKMKELAALETVKPGGPPDNDDSLISKSGASGDRNTRDKRLPLKIPGTGDRPGREVEIPNAGRPNPDYIPPNDDPSPGDGGGNDRGSGNGGNSGNPDTDESENDEAQKDEAQENPGRRVRMVPSPFQAVGGGLVYVPALTGNFRAAWANLRDSWGGAVERFRGLWGRWTGSTPDNESSGTPTNRLPAAAESGFGRSKSEASSNWGKTTPDTIQRLSGRLSGEQSEASSDWAEASRELNAAEQIMQSDPDELLDSLGHYGNPSLRDGPMITTSNAPPKYVSTDTDKMIGWGFLSDGLTPEYGILTSIASGSGFAGSLTLRTYRIRGHDEVVSHQLFAVFETDDLMHGTGNPKHRMQLVDDPDRAQAILLSNPDLMENALINSESSGWRRFWEIALDVFTAQTPH